MGDGARDDTEHQIPGDDMKFPVRIGDPRGEEDKHDKRGQTCEEDIGRGPKLRQQTRRSCLQHDRAVSAHDSAPLRTLLRKSM